MSARRLDPSWVSTVARLAVGAVFAFSGLTKVSDIDGTIRAVRAYRLLPESMVPAVGSALPVLELALAALLLAGLVTRFAAAISGLLFVAFLIGVSSAWARGLSIECGCFGGGGYTHNPVPGYVRELVLDSVLLVACGWLVSRPRSRFSLDTALGLSPTPTAGTGDPVPSVLTGTDVPPSNLEPRLMTNARTARAERAAKVAEMQAKAARAEARRRSLIVTLTIAALLAIGVAVFVVIQNGRRDTTASASAGSGTPRNLLVGANGYGATSAASIAVSKSGSTPAVTLIAYEDFQCPVCKDFEAGNSDQIKAWVAAGQLRVLYRPIAFLDRQSSTNYSTRALNAAAAVVDSYPAGFQKFHDLLYAQQPAEGSAGLTDDKLIDLAVQAGAPRAAVTTDIKKQTFKAWTATVTDDASKAGVTGTPTLIVNGKQLADYSPATVDKAVEAALAGQK